MDINEYRKLLDALDPDRAVLEVLGRAHTESGHRLSHELRTLSFGISHPEHFFNAEGVLKAYIELIGILHRRYVGREDAGILDLLARMENVKLRIEQMERQVPRRKRPAPKRKFPRRRK